MELNDLTVDVKAIEEGTWIENLPDLGDISVKVRGYGSAEYRRKQSLLLRSLPPSKRTNLEEQNKISAKLLLETILMDWKGLTDGGLQVPYSKELAEKLLTDPQYLPFRDGVMWAAQAVAEHRVETLAVEGKNSQTL